MNVNFLVGWAFNIAASANLPALVMLLFWRRTTKQGIRPPSRGHGLVLPGSCSALRLSGRVRAGPGAGHRAFSQPAIVTSPGFLVLVLVSLLTPRPQEPAAPPPPDASAGRGSLAQAAPVGAGVGGAEQELLSRRPRSRGCVPVTPGRRRRTRIGYPRWSLVRAVEVAEHPGARSVERSSHRRPSSPRRSRPRSGVEAGRGDVLRTPAASRRDADADADSGGQEWVTISSAAPG